MNEFTKEELECLHNAIALQLLRFPMSEKNAIKRRELVGKIQSLIDNYCEHECLILDNESGHGKYKRCQDCNPDIQSNQSQVDVDRCQHDPVSIMGVPYEVTMEHGFKYKKCIKCGEFYR